MAGGSALPETISPQVAHLISEDLVRRYTVLPVQLDDNALTVAMTDPNNLQAIDEIALETGCTVVPLQVSAEDLRLTIEQFFSIEERIKQELVDMRVDQLKETMNKEIAAIEDDSAVLDQPIVKLMNDIIAGAISQGASDIHLEPQDPEMRVRYRVDGVLRDIMTIPKSVEPSLISRAKILSDMDITEKRQPQDGHANFEHHGEVYDLRLSCMPTVIGEKIVLRILDKERMHLSLPDLGFYSADTEILHGLAAKPYGIIFVTGPTGSGKTTTLYSMLNRMNKDEKNIVTVEDPVEYRLTGISQTQVNPQANVSFANGLRAFLRQDPDIIMVGEVRDLETAEIAIQAALTGHLVLSTLHTNDASTAITRLMDMGVEPFLLSSTVIGVIAQRLARMICDQCQGSGCTSCFGSGKKGRTVVYEVMSVSDSIQKLINQKVDSTELKKQMISEQMMTFQECAKHKVADGVCSEDEIKRVIF